MQQDKSLLTREVFEAFQEEAGELLEKWSKVCLELESNPSRGNIDNLFRVLHTLKGNSQCVGQKDYGQLVHKVEELVYLIRDGDLRINEDVISFLLEVQSRLQHWTDEMVDNPEYHPGIEDLMTYINNNFAKKVEIRKSKAKETVSKKISTQKTDPAKKTILIVEDEITIQSLLCATFQNSYNIILADNGVQGLKRFYQHKNEINLILTDIFMPQMDGVKMIASIREKHNTPVIVMSGLMQERFGELKGFKSLITVSKPIETASLLLTVLQMLKGPKKPR